MEPKRNKIEERMKKEDHSENYSLRGRKFEGHVIKKFEKRVTVGYEKVIFVKKYERYMKSYSKLHARLPENLKDKVNVGDYIQIMECRPLSKIIHFVVIKKIRDADSKASEIIRETAEIKTKKSKEKEK